MYSDSIEKNTQLVGKNVKQVLVNQDESKLAFICEDGYSEFWDTEGDCCSRSWWSDIYSLKSLLNAAQVQAVKVIDLPPQLYTMDQRDRSEEDQAYGFQIDTGWGATTFVFRNASNGYYGGWAFIGSSHGDTWREITENDWSA